MEVGGECSFLDISRYLVRGDVVGRRSGANARAGSAACRGLGRTVQKRLKRDGTLDGAPRPEIPWQPTAYLQDYQQSALQALLKCQPYDLPAADYEQWKYFVPVFTEPSPAMSDDRGTPSDRILAALTFY
jgi:hypothetical protein